MNQKELQLTQFVPARLVAGVASVGNKKAYSAAYYAISELLNEDEVRFVHHVYKDKVYYLGAREKDFTMAGSVGSALAAAFPGAPGHKGAASYVFEQNEVAAAVVFNGSTLECRTGPLTDITRWTTSKDLPVVKVSSNDPSLRWMNDRSLQTEKASGILSKALAGCIGFAAISALALVGMQGIKAAAEPRVEAQADQVRVELNRVATQIQQSTRQPIFAQLDALQNVIDTAVDADGEVLHVRLDKNKQLYAIVVPPYVQESQYKGLNPTQVFLDPKTNGVVVTNDPTVLNPNAENFTAKTAPRRR